MGFKNGIFECWARIGGKDYPIALGWTLTEEFSETLDSAEIILPHVRGVIDLKPYDDVVIHDFDPYVSKLPGRPYGQIIDTSVYRDKEGNDISDEVSKTPEFSGHFYRHMLISGFSREIINIGRSNALNGDTFYNYSISLFSETKGLETVQLPNRTITQPIGTTELGAAGGIPSYRKVSTMNFNLPYSTVGDWKDGCMVKTWGIPPSGNPYSYKCYVFAGSMVGSGIGTTSSYSLFSQMKGQVRIGESFTLPDWNVSGVTVLIARNDGFPLFVYKIGESFEFHPMKHWFVRKVGVNDSAWSSRASILSNIKEMVEEGSTSSFPEIVYHASSRDQVSVVSTSLAEGGQYVFYMWCEPDVFDLTQYGLSYSFNVYAMVQDGIGIPTEDGDFLIAGNFSCVSVEDDAQADVLTVYEAVRQAIELYSPYVKITDDGSNWEYRRKYSISEETKNKFRDVIAPENQWNLPNLRDYITRLFYVADCIPVVKDNVICHMSLAKRDPEPFDLAKGSFTYENYSMDAGSYCDRTIRNYNDGLSKENVVNCVDRIGFKNSDSPTLTLEGLRLELSHPIYRINKVYMCYYNEYSIEGQTGRYMKLCKQDITPLVLLSSRRNLLSEDWATLGTVAPTPANINELAKFKYATIGYDIGSQYLSGWGMKYSFPQYVFWSSTKTVLENIYNFVSAATPAGVDDGAFDDYGDATRDNVFTSNASDDREALDQNDDVIEITYENIAEQAGGVSKYIGNFTQRLRGMVFIIEYEGYVSSAVVASKDFHDGNVVSRDNPQSSLSFLESDGVNQKEKVNRLGNPNHVMTARYKAMEDIQRLASVLDDELHEDAVVFKRQISFNRDYFSVNYYLCRNYVIRNYFTSVYAKNRPFPLASYEESVRRQENRTLEILVSPTESYYQNSSKKMDVWSFGMQFLFSFWKPAEYDGQGNVKSDGSIDKAYYCVYPSRYVREAGQAGGFATDLQKFTSGNSLCFVVAMKDNASGGVFVSDLNKNLGSYVGEAFGNGVRLAVGLWDMSANDVTATDLLTGAKQDWFLFPVNPRTGSVNNMSFSVGISTHDGTSGQDEVVDYSLYEIALNQLLPLLDCVFSKPNGEKYYFGALNEDGWIVGAGYPRIKFRKKNGFYFADMSDANIPYLYDEFVTDETARIYNYDKETIAPRPEIQDFLRAKFVGSEREGADETDDCVFKDGKELISATLQLEPIYKDTKVMFSDYMMKLSDAVGSKSKDYEDSEIEAYVILDKCLSNVRARRLTHIQSGGVTTEFYRYAVFSAPSLVLGIPTTANASYPIYIGKAFDFEEKDGDPEYYRIYIDSIVGEQVENGYTTIVANGAILFNGTWIYGNGTFGQEEYLPLKFRRQNAYGVVWGRTDGSNFSVGKNLPKLPSEYNAYYLVEDGLFIATNGNPHFYADDPTNHYLLVDYTGTNVENSLVRYFDVPNQGWEFDAIMETPTNYSNADAYEEYFDQPGSLVRLDSYQTLVGHNLTMGSGSEYGPIYVISKKKNMNWCVCPPMTKETPYEKVTDLSDFVTFPNDGYDFDPESDITYDDYYKGHIPSLYVRTPGKIDPQTGRRVHYPVRGRCSLRLYYLEGDVYNFVFGVNIDNAENEGVYDDVIYPEEDGVTYVLRLSVMDDRSKTVIDNVVGSDTMGDPMYRIVNFEESDEQFADNLCVAKGN